MSADNNAAWAASICALDPWSVGGAWLKASPGEPRDRWLALLAELLPPGARIRRVPFNVPESRLTNALDLDATLRFGRVIEEQGIFAQLHDGVIVISMAERTSAATAAQFGAVLDSGTVQLGRDQRGQISPSKFGVVTLDESASEEERLPSALSDRLGMIVDLRAAGARDELAPAHSAAQVAAARTRVAQVTIGAGEIEALCSTAMALGVTSLRSSLLTLRVACAAAALAGHSKVQQEDMALALSLVCAPRATQVPAAQGPSESPQDERPNEESPNEEPSTESEPDPADSAQQPQMSAQEMQELLIAAAAAAIPAKLLDSLKDPAQPKGARNRSAGAGAAAGRARASAKGRPAGTRAGRPNANARLNLIETLRAAAPWQTLRRNRADSPSSSPRIRILPQDFRVNRSKPRTQTLTIFSVDASGSSALHRLAEAKGSVELLLADCYVRRDEVALVAFRGRDAQVLLPPTRSLVRAKRSLASLPAGGGTPLARGIAVAFELARLAQRRGDRPTIVLLSDGRANVAEDGTPGRERAQREAEQRARSMSAYGISALFIDTSPRPNAQAGDLARSMGARYVALPFADARAVSKAVRELS